MDAALRIAEARGHDLAVISELLGAAEAGLVEALCADARPPDLGWISATNVSSWPHCQITMHCLGA